MLEILNVAVSLLSVLFQMYEWRNEMTVQGRDWSRFLKHVGKMAEKSEKRKYKNAVQNFKDREIELNKAFICYKYTAVIIVVLTFTYCALYYASHHVEVWLSAILVPIGFIIASWLIKRIIKILGISVEIDDAVFVISCILCIPLTIRNWKLGLYAVALTLGKYIWIDVLQRKAPIAEVRNAFVNEIYSVSAAFRMNWVYLLLYVVYIFAIKMPAQKYFVMCAAYICVVAGVISFGNGVKITTRVTKETVDKKLKEKK